MTNGKQIRLRLVPRIVMAGWAQHNPSRIGFAGSSGIRDSWTGGLIFGQLTIFLCFLGPDSAGLLIQTSDGNVIGLGGPYLGSPFPGYTREEVSAAFNSKGNQQKSREFL